MNGSSYSGSDFIGEYAHQWASAWNFGAFGTAHIQTLVPKPISRPARPETCSARRDAARKISRS